MTFPVPGANWSYVHGVRKVADTGLAGYALQNGTSPIISWTAPNDGNLHTVLITATQHVTVIETGGQLAISWTAPDGTPWTSNFVSAGAGVGVNSPFLSVTVQPGSTVSLVQFTALTAGAATVWALMLAI